MINDRPEALNAPPPLPFPSGRPGSERRAAEARTGRRGPSRRRAAGPGPLGGRLL